MYVHPFSRFDQVIGLAVAAFSKLSGHKRGQPDGQYAEFPEQGAAHVGVSEAIALISN
jgi:hypothetical protein